MSNIKKILYLNFAWSFLVVQAIMVPYYRSKGLSYEQIGLIGSIFSACLLLLDLPTGYIADTFGRRRAIILAGLFKGIGGTLLYYWPSFHGFIWAFVFIGVGNSLFSGTDVALLYDGADKRTNWTATHASRFQWSQWGAASSAVIGGLLAQHSLDLAIAVNAVVAWSSFFLALTLKETPTQSPPRINHLVHFGQTLKKICWQNRFIRYLIPHRIFFSAILLLQVAQIQIFWSALKIPIGWFGVLWAGHSVLSIIFSRMSVKWDSRISFSVLFGSVILIPVIGFLGSAFALKIGIMGALFMLLFEAERGLINGRINAELNSQLPPANRAFGNSVVSMGSRSIFVVAAPLAGKMVDHNGLAQLFGILTLVTLVGGVLITVPLFNQRTKSKSPDETVSTLGS